MSGMVACVAAALALFLASPLSACEAGIGDVFAPDRSKFVDHTKGVPEALPAPVVAVGRITRGTAAPGRSCDDAGIVQLSLRLPESSGYSISEVGFYFRVISGASDDRILPSVPIVGPIESRTMEISFAWLDGHPQTQKPLDLRVEVFAVAHDLSIGPSTELSVQAPVGSAPSP